METLPAASHTRKDRDGAAVMPFLFGLGLAHRAEEVEKHAFRGTAKTQRRPIGTYTVRSRESLQKLLRQVGGGMAGIDEGEDALRRRSPFDVHERGGPQKKPAHARLVRRKPD